MSCGSQARISDKANDRQTSERLSRRARGVGLDRIMRVCEDGKEEVVSAAWFGCWHHGVDGCLILQLRYLPLLT